MLDLDDLAEIPSVPEATTVIGDINSVYWYVQSGKAFHEWNRRIQQLQDQFDAEAKEHPDHWNHIIMRFS